MGLHGGGVDEHLRRRSADLCERAEQIDPNAFGGPTHIAVVERLFRSVFRRRIDPAPTRFQHMNNAADDPVVVNARFAARVSRKVRRNLRKLRVRKPKLISIHQRFLSETRESRSRVQANHFMGLDPKNTRLTPHGRAELARRVWNAVIRSETSPPPPMLRQNRL